jgi:hypothetical protein
MWHFLGHVFLCDCVGRQVLFVLKFSWQALFEPRELDKKFDDNFLNLPGRM